MFIASTYWNGAMNVADMRTAEHEEDAWNYLLGLAKAQGRDDSEGSMDSFMRYTRIYEVFPDKPPRLVRAKKGQKWLLLAKSL